MKKVLLVLIGVFFLFGCSQKSSLEKELDALKDDAIELVTNNFIDSNNPSLTWEDNIQIVDAYADIHYQQDSFDWYDDERTIEICVTFKYKADIIYPTCTDNCIVSYRIKTIVVEVRYDQDGKLILYNYD